MQDVFVPDEALLPGADMAVGCTYKFLNGGPGSPAFIWVSEDLQNRFAQPLSGWWSHARPFEMSPDYAPADGIRRFLTGTQAQCIEAIETAIAERRWAVVPLWQPQFLHAQHRLRELHEPLGLLGGIDRAVLLAREDRLQHFSPQHLQVLDNIRLSNAQVAELDLAINRGGLQPQAAAQAWQAANPRTFGQWLEPIDG